MIKKLQEISVKSLKSRRGIDVKSIEPKDQIAKVFVELSEFMEELEKLAYMEVVKEANGDNIDTIKEKTKQKAIDVVRVILSLFENQGWDIREAWKRNIERNKDKKDNLKEGGER